MWHSIKKSYFQVIEPKLMGLKKHIEKSNDKPTKQLVILSLLVYLILESLSSRSLLIGVQSVWDNPLMFVQNVLIILLTLTVANFFARRNFMVLVIATSWLMLGLCNFILLGYRTTPLTAADIGILKSVIDIIKVYMNYFEIFLVLLLILAVCVGIVIAFRRFAKQVVQLKNAFFVFCSALVLLLGVNELSFRSGAVTDNFTNIAQAFQDYGFAYCFSISLVDRGIDEPETYSQETISSVLEAIDYIDEVPRIPSKYSAFLEVGSIKPDLIKVEKPQPVDEDIVKPNVVMVQLESFFDVRYLKDYTFSNDPTPHFNRLKNAFSSGFLTVPSIGAGTANTEFEVLTGMSLKFFGAGEYPYKTVLKDKAVESIAFNLDRLGYYTHAIHNNTGTFYSRHRVFANLGFDSYSSLEYMQDVTYNPLGWANDSILTTEIMKALEATQEQDFVFAVSVQPHGKYPSEVVDENQTLTMTGELDPVKHIGYEYFINQLHETDQMINDLTQQLAAYDEPVVLVLYGDHLPTMGIEDEHLSNGNKFQTEYVLWSNFPLSLIDKDLTAYQLNAYVMERLGYDEGIITKFHQMNATSDDYMETLLLLQYDMLFGENKVYGGYSPYKAKQMKMGVDPIVVSYVSQRGETVFIKGKHFTRFSAVFLDGVQQESFFVDENTLILPIETLDVYQTFYIAQLTPKGFALSQTEEVQVFDLILNP